MLAGAQCRDRRLPQFGVLAVEPFLGLTIAEPRIFEKDEGPSEAAENLVAAIDLDELVARDCQWACSTCREKPPVGDQSANVTESNAEGFRCLGNGQVVWKR